MDRCVKKLHRKLTELGVAVLLCALLVIISNFM